MFSESYLASLTSRSKRRIGFYPQKWQHLNRNTTVNVNKHSLFGDVERANIHAALEYPHSRSPNSLLAEFSDPFIRASGAKGTFRTAGLDRHHGSRITFGPSREELLCLMGSRPSGHTSLSTVCHKLCCAKLKVASNHQTSIDSFSDHGVTFQTSKVSSTALLSA